MTPEELKTFGGVYWMPKRKYPKTKNATHQRGNFTHPNHHPIEIRGNNDIMFINGIRFINTISIHLKFMTEEHIDNADATTIQESTRQVKEVYIQRGFNITNILMDRQFSCIRGNLAEL